MTRVIRFTGDIHGNFDRYIPSLEDIEESIQVGDFGVGFGGISKAPVIDAMLSLYGDKHKFIRGNHDNPEECKKCSKWIPDGIIDGPMMFVGGASSIDKLFRIENVSWWEDEELSLTRLSDMIALYEKHKPYIMVTHDIPTSIADNLMIPAVGGIQEKSKTRNALEVMLQINPPKLWIYGHWHTKITKTIKQTTYVCLPELAFVDIDVDKV